MADMHHDPFELAVLLFMNEKGNSTREEEHAGCVIGSQESPLTWFLEPGRSHVPAEMGGRIASPQNPDLTGTGEEGNWLDEFDVGHRVTDFHPLGFDAHTSSYTGTMLWETRQLTEQLFV